MKEEKNSNLSFEDLRIQYFKYYSKMQFMSDNLGSVWKFYYQVIILSGIVLSFIFFLAINCFHSISKFSDLLTVGIILVMSFIFIYLIAFFSSKYGLKKLSKKSELKIPECSNKKRLIRFYFVFDGYVEENMKLKQHEFEKDSMYSVYDNIDILRDLMDDTKFIIDNEEQKETNRLVIYITIALAIMTIIISTAEKLDVEVMGIDNYIGLIINLVMLLLAYGAMIYYILKGVCIIFYDLFYPYFSITDLKKYYVFLTSKYLTALNNNKEGKLYRRR